MQTSLQTQASTLLSAGSTSALERMAAATQGDPAAVNAAAEEFEAVMLTAMLKPIFEGVEISEPFGGGEGEKMWQGLLVEEYAKEMAASGGIGIADQVRAELLRIQEDAVN
jgi:Rod binding domain-containing protein